MTDGAVASLVPGNTSLKKAPPPNITDAAWRAIAATNTSGAERSGLQLFIRALYASQKNAPTLDAIVGPPNDDVVSLSSQLAGSPKVSVVFKGLAHSAILGKLSSSVVNSSAAEMTAACWLLNPINPACTSLAKTVPEVIAANQKTGEPSFARGRLTVMPKATAQLGHPLTLSLSAPGVRRFGVRQLSLQPRNGYIVSETDVINVPSPTGSASQLTMLPRVFGLVRLEIDAEFDDGSVDMTSATINVSVDPKDIVGLRADANNASLAISRTGGGMLNAVIDVRGLDKPVDVASFTRWRLVSPPVNPALTITSGGDMTAIHPGVATVEGTFLGQKILTDITVTQY